MEETTCIKVWRRRGPFGEGSECALTEVREEGQEEAIPTEGDRAAKTLGRTTPFFSGH